MNWLRIFKSCLFVLVFIAGSLSQSFAATAKAHIMGTSPESSVQGNVTAEDVEGGILVTANVRGAEPGMHGFHIHEFGDCSDAGKAAGGHFNPAGNPHGYLPQDGISAAHAGDMGNLLVEDNGEGTVEINLPGLRISDGPFSVAGRAIVLHAKKDDFGQPTGNAGSREACGPLVITGN